MSFDTNLQIQWVVATCKRNYLFQLYRNACCKIPIAVLNYFFQGKIYQSNVCKANQKYQYKFCFGAYKSAVKKMPRNRLTCPDASVYMQQHIPGAEMVTWHPVTIKLF